MARLSTGPFSFGGPRDRERGLRGLLVTGECFGPLCCGLTAVIRKVAFLLWRTAIVGNRAACAKPAIRGLKWLPNSRRSWAKKSTG